MKDPPKSPDFHEQISITRKRESKTSLLQDNSMFRTLDYLAGVANILGWTQWRASVTSDAGRTISTVPSSKS